MYTRSRHRYYPSRALSGTVQQVEKYILCLTDSKVQQDSFYKKLSEKLFEKLHGEINPRAINPRGLILLGRSRGFNNQQKMDFELIRRQYRNIADIMTYDDLINRFERIITSLK